MYEYVFVFRVHLYYIHIKLLEMQPLNTLDMLPIIIRTCRRIRQLEIKKAKGASALIQYQRSSALAFIGAANRANHLICDDDTSRPWGQHTLFAQGTPSAAFNEKWVDTL